MQPVVCVARCLETGYGGWRGGLTLKGGPPGEGGLPWTGCDVTHSICQHEFTVPCHVNTPWEAKRFQSNSIIAYMGTASCGAQTTASVFATKIQFNSSSMFAARLIRHKLCTPAARTHTRTTLLYGKAFPPSGYDGMLSNFGEYHVLESLSLYFCLLFDLWIIRSLVC